MPCSVTPAAWSQRTTNDRVPVLPPVLLRWECLSAGGSSTFALLARIVHDGFGAATTGAGAAVFTGAMGVPAITFPPSSPIRQNRFDEHARPVTSLWGSTAEVDQVAASNGGVEEVRTFPSSSAATHSEPVGQTSCVIALSGSMLAEGADQFEAVNGAVPVSTRPSESIATHALLDGHASS